jgi:hypothetical protein
VTRWRSVGLIHVAIGLAPGSLGERARADIVGFYGDHFGWVELHEFARPDRMTIAIGGGHYLNLREVEGAVEHHAYEHIGLGLPGPEAVDGAWAALTADPRRPEVDDLQRGPGDFRQFRLRYALPVTIEVQHVPVGRMEPPSQQG